jgi:RsiW-degrading membrane proteinase PrsW (M82 family)
MMEVLGYLGLFSVPLVVVAIALRFLPVSNVGTFAALISGILAGMLAWGFVWGIEIFQIPIANNYESRMRFFFVVPIEEFLKISAFVWLTKRSGESAQVATAILVAAGFSIFENLTYASNFGGEVAQFRALTPALMHMSVAVFYAGVLRNLPSAIALASFVVVIHLGYNFLIWDSTLIPIAVVGLLVVFPSLIVWTNETHPKMENGAENRLGDREDQISGELLFAEGNHGMAPIDPTPLKKRSRGFTAVGLVTALAFLGFLAFTMSRLGDNLPSFTDGEPFGERSVEQFQEDDARNFLLEFELPLEMDEVTTLYSVLPNGVSLQYFYWVQSTEIDLVFFQENQGNQLISHVCLQDNMWSVLNFGGIYEYFYTDPETGRLIGHFLISLADCAAVRGD